MGGEELPHDVGGGDMIAADAQAGPHVVAALNGVEGYGGAVLAAGIDVGMGFGGFGMLGCGRAAVFFHPKRNGAGDGIVFAARRLERSRAAVKRDELVVRAVKNEK